MSLTLHTPPGNFRAFKALIAAEYCGENVKIPAFKEEDAKSPAFLAKSPLGKVPVLDTPKGPICESNAIARYIARMRADKELYGATFYESAQVDSWIDFCAQDVELPASLWFYPILGYLKPDAALSAKAKNDLGRALGVLEAHLADKTYLVGHRVTLADITVVSALVYPFKFVADAAYRAAFPNVIRWFSTCVNQREFVAVVGKVVLCEKALSPGSGAVIESNKGGGSKKEKKDKGDKPKGPAQQPKKEKAPKPKDDDDMDDMPPPPKKEDHIFKKMDQANKGPFVMDTWKKTYSNCATYDEAMKYFWDNFDPEGWSLWRGDYKHNHENTVLFMTSNLIGGFIQRTDEIRKWLFGTMTIRGVEKTETTPADFKITCYYLIRGQDITPLIKCNDDAEQYNWTKVATPVSDADKAVIKEYWTSETELEKTPLLDSRVYK
jgi:elongation factor 1-gamma